MIVNCIFLEYLLLGIQMFLAQELQLAAELCTSLSSYTYSNYFILGEVFVSPTEKIGGHAIMATGRFMTERKGTRSVAVLKCSQKCHNKL